MGVNCYVTLNPKADWRTVGTVAAILLGDKAEKKPLGTDGSFHTQAATFGFGKAQVIELQPEYLNILLALNDKNPVAKLINKSDGYQGSYRLWYGLESKTLYPKATAAKIALAEGICKFFGGKIVYNDCTDKKRTFPAPSYIGASDAKPWERLHQALFDLAPLTDADLKRCAKHAAY